MFKWPKMLKIGLDKIEIRYLNRKQYEKQHHGGREKWSYGQFRCDINVIIICTETPSTWELGANEPLKPKEIFNTLVHEIIHKICEQYDISDDEMFVNLFSIEFTKLLQECGIKIPPVKKRSKK